MRNAFLLLALAALVTVTGCAKPDTYEVHISPAFTPDQQGEILAALDAWTAAVPVHFHPTVTADGCSNDPLAISQDGCFVVHPSTEMVGPGDAYWGWTTPDEHDVAIDVSIDPDFLPTVFAHEVGHAMGLGHNPDPETLMYWKPCVLGLRAPTPKDVAAFFAR